VKEVRKELLSIYIISFFQSYLWKVLTSREKWSGIWNSSLAAHMLLKLTPSHNF